MSDGEEQDSDESMKELGSKGSVGLLLEQGEEPGEQDNKVSKISFTPFVYIQSNLTFHSIRV